MNEDRRAFFGISILHIGLARQEALAVDGAGGDPADALTGRVNDRVAVVCHSHALVVEAEAHDYALAFLLAGCIRVPADEPGLVQLDVRAKAAFANAQILLAELAGAEAHLVTVERQAGLRAER